MFKWASVDTSKKQYKSPFANVKLYRLLIRFFFCSFNVSSLSIQWVIYQKFLYLNHCRRLLNVTLLSNYYWLNWRSWQLQFDVKSKTFFYNFLYENFEEKNFLCQSQQHCVSTLLRQLNIRNVFFIYFHLYWFHFLQYFNSY